MAEPHLLAAHTRETRDQPAPDETSPTFHRFPDLPTEIRLQIWKNACFPRSKIDHGIHYVTANIVHEDEEEYNVVLDYNLEGFEEDIDLEGDKNGYITLTAPKRPRENPASAHTSSSHPNASACLWDPGLLTTCKESRLAITEYYDLEGWRNFRDQSNNTTQTDAWYDKDYPSSLVPHKGHEKWCPMVVPLFDIFCIDTSRIQTLPKSLYRMKLLAPFISTRTFTIMESWNIALKFNRSWNTNFPYDIDRLRYEMTPRGLLANWLFRYQDEIYPEPSVWIIDDSVSWVGSRDQKYTPVYRDYDGDYIQINWENTRRDGASGDVTLFIRTLGEVLEDDGGFLPFQTNKIVKLLVRKDNEIPWDQDEGFELSDVTQDESDGGPWGEDDDKGDGNGISSEEDD
jgi:hypothetical protein